MYIDFGGTTIIIEYPNYKVGSARKMVVLSWGHPGQRGYGHVNGRTSEEVEQMMNERGWEKNERHTEMLRTAANAPWLKSNVQVFDKALEQSERGELSLFPTLRK